MHERNLHALLPLGITPKDVGVTVGLLYLHESEFQYGDPTVTIYPGPPNSQFNSLALRRETRLFCFVSLCGFGSTRGNISRGLDHGGLYPPIVFDLSVRD